MGNLNPKTSSTQVIRPDGSTAEQSLALISSPNLLINGDFSIWQRGTTLTSSSSFDIADLWRLELSNFTGTTTTSKATDQGGIKISTTADKVVSLRARISKAECRKMRGKTVTLSYSAGGTVYSYTMEDFGAIWMQDNAPLTDYCSTYTDLINKEDINFIVIQYKLKANQSITIDWVRLEYGDYPTKHIAEDISLAYLRCARYIMAINIKNRITMTNAGGSTLSYPIDTPVPMVSNLTITGITLPVDVSFRFNGSAKKATWKSMTVNRISDNNIGISIVLETALPQLYVGYTADTVSFIIDGTPTE